MLPKTAPPAWRTGFTTPRHFGRSLRLAPAPPTAPRPAPAPAPLHTWLLARPANLHRRAETLALFGLSLLLLAAGLAR